MGLRLAESRVQAALEKQALLQAQLEEQLQDKVLCEKDLAQQQMQSNLDKPDLSARWLPGGCRTRQASLQKVKLENWGEGSICSLGAGPSSVSSASLPRHPTEVPKAFAPCIS
ncbi:rootletin [Pongo pygmaeus]|uniref:rootletin n=1 Tax=Pongo pygmaeus TaxID=9600 RepID=UPI00300DAD07